LRERSSWREVAVLALTAALAIWFAVLAAGPATAQLVIPHGDFDNEFEKYLVVAVSLGALIFAAWRHYKQRR
jgi:hypothetical protein